MVDTFNWFVPIKKAAMDLIFDATSSASLMFDKSFIPSLFFSFSLVVLGGGGVEEGMVNQIQCCSEHACPNN